MVHGAWQRHVLGRRRAHTTYTALFLTAFGFGFKSVTLSLASPDTCSAYVHDTHLARSMSRHTAHLMPRPCSLSAPPPIM